MTRFLITLGVALACALPVSAQTTTIFIDPQSTQLSGTGETITLDVRIEDYTDFQNFTIPIFYNEAALEYQSTSNRGQIFTSEGYQVLCFDESDTNKGKIQVDCSLLGTESVSGTDELAYTVTLQAVGEGGSNLIYVDSSNTRDGQTIRLRDPNNDPIPYSGQEAIVTVESPLPDTSSMSVYADDSTQSAFPAANGTKARLRVNDSGGDNGGKITTALYEETPPGGDDATFIDPDGLVTDPSVSNRYWELTNSLSGAYDVDVRFSYAGLGGINNPSELRVARRGLAAGASENWTLVPGAQTTVDETNQEVEITSNSEMEFGSGQYALVSDDNPLPVELASFAGQADGRAAVLTWRTLSEHNSEGFYIEQKTGKGQWKTVSSLIEGAGTSQEAQTYSHRVEDLDFGRHVFRLRQKDRDGNTQVFKDRRTEVNVQMKSAYTLEAAYPNPFTSQTTVRFAVREAQPVNVALYNTLGQRVRVLRDGAAPSGKTVTLTLDGTQLSSGTYFVRLRGEDFTTSETVTLVR